MSNLQLAKKYLDKLKQYVVAADANKSISGSLVALGLDVVADFITKEEALTPEAAFKIKKEYLNRWDAPLVNPPVTLSGK